MVSKLKDGDINLSSLPVSLQAKSVSGTASEAATAYISGTLDDFTGRYAFLHPDFPTCVAHPISVGSMGEYDGQMFYPSLSCAIIGFALSTSLSTEDIDHELLRSLLGGQESAYSVESCQKYMSERLEEIKDGLLSEGFLTRWQAQREHNPRFLEAMESMIRDKFMRNDEIRKHLVETCARPIRYQSDFGKTELMPPPSFMDKSRPNISLLDCITMKVREDFRHPVRGIFRWILQQAPVELELRRRPFLVVSDLAQKELRDQSYRAIRSGAEHILRNKVDRRQYFVEEYDNTRVIDRYPRNEMEDKHDDEAMRRKKRQRLANDLTGIDRKSDGPNHSLVLCFGRSEDNEIICEDEAAERYHCAILPLVAGIFAIVDLRSSLGTYLDGVMLAPLTITRLTPTRRDSEHILQIGHQKFSVRCGELEKEQLRRAKRRELEQRLRAIEAGLIGSGSNERHHRDRRRDSDDDEEQRQFVVVLSGWPRQFASEDVESILNQKQFRYTVRLTRTLFLQHIRPTNNSTYIVSFECKMVAWKAKEYFNGRIVRGRTISARLEDN